VQKNSAATFSKAHIGKIGLRKPKNCASFKQRIRLRYGVLKKLDQAVSTSAISASVKPYNCYTVG